jgi:hypothetical protein
MNGSQVSESYDARLYRAGSLAAFGYLAAQTAQELIVVASATPATALAERLAPLDHVRAFVLWLSFLVLPMAYWALSRLAASRPSWSRIGLVASLAFVGCELAYRTIDLFVVTQWAETWAAADSGTRVAMARRIAAWDELVLGWYVLLLTLHAIGTFAFALALGPRERALFATLVAYTALMALRLGAYGSTVIERACEQLYFPIVAIGFATLAVVLWRRAGGR